MKDDVYNLLSEIEGRVFTTAQAADILHVSERYVRELITSKKLEAVMFKGLAYLISMQALQSYACAYDKELFAEAGEMAREAVSRALQLRFDDASLPSFTRRSRR